MIQSPDFHRSSLHPFTLSRAPPTPHFRSAIIAGRKLDNAEQTGTSVIVADNPGCLMQIRGALHARHSPMRALHLVELIDERLRDWK